MRIQQNCSLFSGFCQGLRVRKDLQEVVEEGVVEEEVAEVAEVVVAEVEVVSGVAEEVEDSEEDEVVEAVVGDLGDRSGGHFPIFPAMFLNESGNLLENENEPLSAFSQTEHNIVAAYLITAGVISLLSNIIVLGIFVKYKELRTATNAIIINLAFTDIGVSGIGYPMSAASDLHGSWKFGYTGCQIYAALNIFFGMASIGLLTVVAIDRYLTICKPHIGSRLTPKNYTALILAAWINAVFWASMPVVGWASYAPDPTGATCTVNWRKNDASFVSFTMSVIAVNFVIPLSIMFFCYYNVSKTMKMYARNSCLEGINIDWSDQVDVTKLCQKDAMYLIAAICIVMSFFEEVDGFCPSQCTCIYHGRSDGSGTRSVLCNDPDMFEIPVNVPVDTVKLRIEKTVIRKIPTEAFYYLVDLRYLWLTYNSLATIDTSSFYNLKQLHELRLDGNLLSSFPWESLAEMPNLRTLDLHNNKVTSIPAEGWQVPKKSHLPGCLQDNPWYCDCRISKLIEFSKIVDHAVVLLDPFVACSGPESLAGILFQRAELEQCLKPSVMTSATKITSPLGSNVLLRCDATGYPTPQLLWVRSDNLLVNYTVIQESPGEGVRWSILSLTGISYKDAGDYKCKAKNLAGMSEASVTVTVVGVVTTTVSPQKYGKKPGAEQQNTTQEETKTESLNVTIPSASVLPSTTSSPTTLITTERSATESTTDQRQLKSMPDGKKNSKTFTNGSKKQPVDTSKKRGSTSLSAAEQTDVVKNLRVIPETDERVTLMWKTVNATRNPALTVLYSKYGEKDMLPLSTDPTKNKVTIDGLEPGIQYMACVCPKGIPPTKDQCIIFSTDGMSMEEDSQIPILLVAGGIACVVILPIIFFLLYKVLMLHRKPKSTREADLEKETYVKFETLSLKPRSVGAGGELWARRNTEESERLLLCSRASMDSQMTFKSEGSRSEYFC
ncbi:hypothetical protein JRQ81_016803 [Phrynocephalus forsythii]|uniref:Uncharacterized protein n=1 Tax=Phrynocephalus forsythii TaxID=171643 RepID=A0A9Q0XTJ5_9SAUR|nr:hypothetical protein JRQ81_016803 [Phrynocephalus forsythii]